MTVRQAAQKRGIKKPYQLTQVLGDGNDRSRAARLWKGKPIPSLETLDEVAAALGDCELSELVTRVPDKRRRKSPARQGGTKKKGGSGQKVKAAI